LVINSHTPEATLDLKIHTIQRHSSRGSFHPIIAVDVGLPVQFLIDSTCE